MDTVFEWLSAEPLAAASLGQVYRGKLREEWGGGEVAVKVQRPGVLEQVAMEAAKMPAIINPVTPAGSSAAMNNGKVASTASSGFMRSGLFL